MKKLLLTLTLVAAVVSAYGQGSVAFSNGLSSKLSTQEPGSPAAQFPGATASYKFGLWYGLGSAGAVNTAGTPWILGYNSSTTTGVIASSVDRKTPLSNVSLGTETSVQESDVWVQIKAWSFQYDTWQLAQAAFAAGTTGVGFYESPVLNINNLGNPGISGVTLWESATGTNPKLFNAFVIPVNAIPEPGTFALAGLGAAALLIFRRRK
jgi:hypothetical protein